MKKFAILAIFIFNTIFPSESTERYIKVNGFEVFVDKSIEGTNSIGATMKKGDTRYVAIKSYDDNTVRFSLWQKYQLNELGWKEVSCNMPRLDKRIEDTFEDAFKKYEDMQNTK